MMTKIIKCLFFLLFCSNFSFGQLVEKKQRINVYANHPNFKYYGDFVKKEKKKSLLQMSYESPLFMEMGNSISLSENELLAINMAVNKHNKNSSSSLPIQSSIYIYKIDKKILYVHIAENKQVAKRVKGGGGSEFLIDLEKMSIVDEWINQK